MGAAAVSKFDRQIGRNVFDILAERNMTQSELSRLLDEPVIRTNRHVNGKLGFKAEDIYRISKALGVSLESLMEGCDDQKEHVKEADRAWS